jgi:hypothetical protein
MLDLILNDKVVNLRAWQLYLGNGIFTFAVGLVLLIIAKLLGTTGIHSETLNKLLSATGRITHARDPHTLLESNY